MLVEMQVIAQDYWDRRSLAYAETTSCRRKVEGTKKSYLFKYSLGGGRDRHVHWVREKDFKRHYHFMDSTTSFTSLGKASSFDNWKACRTLSVIIRHFMRPSLKSDPVRHRMIRQIAGVIHNRILDDFNSINDVSRI